MKRQNWLSKVFQVTFLVAFAGGNFAIAQTPAKKQPSPTAQAVKGAKIANENRTFDAKVLEYAKLHNQLAASLPQLGPKETPEKIHEHQLALAQKLRDARADAKQGDIFSPEVSARIKTLFKNEMTKAPKAKQVRNTIQEGEPLPDMRLKVGLAYPDKLPMTTMPPDLLAKLPQLPKEVTYRIVGHDLILLDQTANIIVDFIPEALP